MAFAKPARAETLKILDTLHLLQIMQYLVDTTHFSTENITRLKMMRLNIQQSGG
jgi:hypothetical protein